MTKKKDTTLKIRLSKSLKNQLIKQSDEKSMSASRYIRTLIAYDKSKELI